MTQQGPAEFMARALQLAARGRYSTFPNPRVGCVVVKNGEVVGEGWHERAGQPHAEIHALRAAGDAARGAEVFVSLEPCSHHGRTPPCADALVASGAAKIWAAMNDPNPRVAGQGIDRLRAHGIECHVGLLKAAARELNRGFVSRMERGRPFVTLKLASSLDGRTAMASGESRWITSEAARADVHRLRAEAGAVLTGSGTVFADNPLMTARNVADGGSRVPDRIVLDSQARVDASASIWNDDGARRFRICGGEAAGLEAPGVERIAVGLSADGRVNLVAALGALATREVNHVLVECGAELAAAFLSDGLVDELICYVAPSLLGDDARGLTRLTGLDTLARRVHLQFKDVRQIGPDLRITAIPVPGAS